MEEFVAIDFETANPKRVSACALGWAKVSGGGISERKGYLINPVGGHAPFQSKIHGIKKEHTYDKPDFGELYLQIKEIFEYPLVGYSLFDSQVLRALSDHFNLRLQFDYVDSCSLAKQMLPDLKNHKLKTVAKHFCLPAFKHHDATEDAVACASIFLHLQGSNCEEDQNIQDIEQHEFIGLAKGVLADDIVNYKEAYALLYWLQDHPDVANEYQDLYSVISGALEDDCLDNFEAIDIKLYLEHSLKI